jgi:DNA polymerase III subunit delta'
LFEVLGQEFPKRYFAEIVKNNKIAHSYIIEGPDGIGKSIFALHMAETLLCNSNDKPCGVCNSCRKIEKMSHPDVKVIDTDKKSIGVNDIRALIDEVGIRPYEGLKKIIIIKKADTITAEGQNALLKTLEEPPDNVNLILLVANLETVLPTIQSRCQLIRLSRVSTQLIKEFLISGAEVSLGEDSGTGRSKKSRAQSPKYDEEKILVAADLSDGIPGRALLQLDSKYSELRAKTIEFACRIINTDPLTGFDQAKFFIDNKEQVSYIFDILNTWNRDIYMFKTTKDKKNVINKDFYDLLIEQSRLLSYNRLDRIMDVLKATEQKMKRNANFQLAIEMMLLKYQEV